MAQIEEQLRCQPTQQQQQLKMVLVTRFEDVEWEKRRDEVRRNKTIYVLTFKLRLLINADRSMILHHLLIMF
jgi:hypothetical protein